MKWMRVGASLVAGMLLLAGCGGSAASEGGGDEPTEVEAVDNCSLLTNEEVTELAGYELVAGEDSPLGCPYIAPGGSVADVRVVGATRTGGARSVAENAFHDAAEIIDVAVGADTVAVTDPSGGAIASILTASGARVVELSVIFIDVEPDDPARIEEAARLAVTALERFGG